MNTDNIELFDRYIEGRLSQHETVLFTDRLDTDKSFRDDFHFYLFILKGIIKKAEKENVDFGRAMKNGSDKDLNRIMNRIKVPRFRNLGLFMAWIASICIK